LRFFPGASPAYAEAARKLAQEMVKNNIALVYGGNGPDGHHRQ
jgi:predicted Rossmann-fold nucleotide-binding protein